MIAKQDKATMMSTTVRLLPIRLSIRFARAVAMRARCLHGPGPRARARRGGGNPPAAFVRLLLLLLLATIVPPPATRIAPLEAGQRALSPSFASTQDPAARPGSASHATPGSVGAPAQGYPRLASMYAFKDSSQVGTFARYGLVVAPNSAAGAVRTLKARSPRTLVILYADTRSVDVADFNGYTVYPGWWLTLAGTTLTGDVDATTTTIHVADAGVIAATFPANADILVDGESMHITAVDSAAHTLTVRRGFRSSAAPHRSGVRVAAHAVIWPGTWLLNVTRYCPADPRTGLTWVAYLVRETQRRLAAAPWDGVFFDDANSRIHWVSGGRIAGANSNAADGGDGPSGQGWPEGQANLLRLMRARTPRALILENGGYYPGFLSGRLFEHFPYFSGGWHDGAAAYLHLSTSGAPTVSVIASDTGDTGTQDLRAMRFGLGTALLGDGYYAYDVGPSVHGQTWWYDEYDGGAGSSLAAGVDAGTTMLTVAPGTGERFRAGEVVRVPSDARTGAGLSLDDEQMRVLRVAGDTLTVRRGVKGSLPAPHAAGDKVATDLQLAGGQGWLGAPLGPARAQSLTTPNALADGDFRSAAAAGAGATNSHRWMLTVAAPAAARFTREAGAVARLTVTRAVPDRAWSVSFAQAGCQVTAGVTYTLSFSARSSAGQTIEAGLQQTQAPFALRASQEFTLDGHWRRYRVTFTPTVSASGLAAQFNLGAAPGTVWLSAVSLQRGDPNVWRRDFAHGTVLLNATATPQTVMLGPGYRRLLGTQDRATNNGAPAPSVTLTPQDAVLLVSTRGR